MFSTRPLLAAAALCLHATVACAADPQDPVKALFGLVAGKAGADYFAGKQLDRLYSESFALTYRITEKVSEMSEAEMMLDFDPIIGGQDSCDVKDIAIRALPAVGAGEDGYVPVEASFDAMSCFEGSEKAPKTKRTFRVIEEKGQYVIDDVLDTTTDDAGKAVTLKELLVGIAAGDMNRVAKLGAGTP
ncbi:hypothetical protein [Gellertiella hungarica]|uniref:DUF3828 domain-containing protein n=1 Tax=Gellertiella hungarica TaxID=1572859 RepID=A0A7W6J632_9HYPH|nr:hypothetical protein [Gellertiella hungarica]MBB4064623.1 hypothetical protein [Gellertiella hungarica]